MIFTGIVLISCNKQGCTDSFALNFEKSARTDDGSCKYKTDLFIGKFTGTDTCNDGSIVNEELVINHVETSEDRIIFQATTRFAISPYAIANGNDLTIPSQTVSSALISVNIIGSGRVDGNQLTVSYVLTEAGQQTTCGFTGTK
ncbi:MAG: hypothetical protein ACK4GL_02715 [Flavobacteriales bacterium]